MIAGCDGFHGVCRPTIADVLTVYEREYPFGWLGILAECAPSSEELIYAHHERGFALASMRSHEVTRMYLQCEPDEDIANWSDEAIWDELDRRFGMSVNRGRGVREGRHPDALVRRRADAAREAVPDRRRRPHRPADRRQGPEHGDGRRLPARPRPRVLLRRRRLAAGALLVARAGARLARPALLLVDDLDAPPLQGRRRLPAAASSSRSCATRSPRRPRRPRWPRTTSACRSSPPEPPRPPTRGAARSRRR